MTLKETLEAFCEFLEANGYMDSDWREEKPSAIDRFYPGLEDREQRILDRFLQQSKEARKLY